MYTEIPFLNSDQCRPTIPKGRYSECPPLRKYNVRVSRVRVSVRVNQPLTVDQPLIVAGLGLGLAVTWRTTNGGHSEWRPGLKSHNLMVVAVACLKQFDMEHVSFASLVLKSFFVMVRVIGLRLGSGQGRVQVHVCVYVLFLLPSSCLIQINVSYVCMHVRSEFRSGRTDTINICPFDHRSQWDTERICSNMAQALQISTALLQQHNIPPTSTAPRLNTTTNLQSTKIILSFYCTL